MADPGWAHSCTLGEQAVWGAVGQQVALLILVGLPHTGDPRAVGWSRLALAEVGGVAETPRLSSTCLSHLSSRLAGGEGRSPKEGRLLRACFQGSAPVKTPNGLLLKQVHGRAQIQGWGNRLGLCGEKSCKVSGQSLDMGKEKKMGPSSSLLLLSASYFPTLLDTFP